MRSASFAAILPALNEEESIGPLLESLSEQSLAPTELIVVDAGSTDRTREEARCRSGVFRSLRVIELDAAYPGRARNVGARTAQSEWLLFIDCGLRLEPGSVAKLFDLARAEDYDVVFARILPKVDSFFEECAATAYLPPTIQNKRAVCRPTSQLVLMKRQAFESTGGFAEHLRSAEDLLFLRALLRAPIKAGYSEESVAYWSLAPDLRSTFHRFRTYSRNNLRAGLYAEWQLRLGIYYLALAATELAAVMFLESLFVPVALLVSFYGARALRRCFSHREGMPAGFGRHALRWLGVNGVLAVIDFATWMGVWDFFARHESRRPGGSSARAAATLTMVDSASRSSTFPPARGDVKIRGTFR